MAPLELADRIEVEPAEMLEVTGFAEDTLVRGALESLARASDTDLAGGSRSTSGSRWRRVSAAEARTLPPHCGSRTRHSTRRSPTCACTSSQPCSGQISRSSSRRGRSSPAGTGPLSSRSTCRRISWSRSSFRAAPGRLRRPPSTGSSTRVQAIAASRRASPRSSTPCEPVTWRNFPATTSTSSPHAGTLEELGAFRADVTGAGPAVYGLFRDSDTAEEAARVVEPFGHVWVGKPRW